MSTWRKPVDHEGRAIDFGKTAADYDRHRPDFPPSMYDRLTKLGWAKPRMRVLDLGTGTGGLALGLAARGLDVIGLDPSKALLDVARRRAVETQRNATFIVGTAEDTGQEAARFDLVTAGQCWWWFDAELALSEVQRVSKPEARLLIANFCYLPTPGSVAGRTEDLILEHNPGWSKAGESGIFESQVRDLDAGGLRAVESFSYVEPVAFTHAGWRGRVRACNGVGAALDPAAVDAFDRDLAARLQLEFPGEMVIPHRVFVVTGSQRA